MKNFFVILGLFLSMVAVGTMDIPSAILVGGTGFFFLFLGVRTSKKRKNIYCGKINLAHGRIERCP